MPQTATPPQPRSGAPSPKQQFADVYAREHATTLKVLRAFPADRADYQPHERSNTALKLAWTFVMENNIALAALKGPLKLGGTFPPPPPSLGEVISAYEASAKELTETLARTPEARFHETIQFPTGPGKMGDYPVIDFLWFMLMDSIHHRG